MFLFKKNKNKIKQVRTEIIMILAERGIDGLTGVCL